MFPIGGTYDFFQMQLSQKKNLCEGHTFGLLFVDPRQQPVEAYITNYLTKFDRSSGKYIDFYLPGYSKNKNLGAKSITIKEVVWNFDIKNYVDFQDKMTERYGIPFSTTAYLLLIEMGPKNKFRKRIKIELDKGKHDPRDIGDFLLKLFEFSKTEIEFEAIQKWLVSSEIKKIFKSTFMNLVQTKTMVDMENVLEVFTLLED